MKKEGFDESAAKAIAGKYPIERILRQLEWISRRKVSRNRLGLLRKAIEQDWARPQQGRTPTPEAELGKPNFRGTFRSLADTLAEARRRLNEPPEASALSASNTP